MGFVVFTAKWQNDVSRPPCERGRTFDFHEGMSGLFEIKICMYYSYVFAERIKK